MSLLFSLMSILVCGFLYRFRGGGFGAEKLHHELDTHPRILVTPFMVLVSWLFFPFSAALAVGVTYLIFVSAPWGRWYTLNRYARLLSGPPTWFETVIETISDFNGKRRDWLAFWLRNSLMLLLGMPLVFWTLSVSVLYSIPFALVTGGCVVGLYELAWRIYRIEWPTQDAEWLTGFLIGILITGGKGFV